MTEARTLAIDRLGAQGDGIADTAAGPVFVPFALPGERFRIEPGGDAHIDGAPSPDRQPAPCRHFGTCGGCVAQHMAPALYAGWKRGIVVEALRQEPTKGTLPVVLFLTDGLPTVGQTSESAIKDAAAKANTFNRRVFTFGVGFDVNAPLLRGLSLQTRAASTFVLPEENVEVKVGSVFRKLSGPVLAMPKLSPAGGNDAGRAVREIQPAALPDLYDGDQLVVLGQYTDAASRQLVLEGNFLGKQRTFEFSFEPAKATTRNGFVPRLWAGRKIATLIDQIRQSAADSHIADPAHDAKTKELVDEVVRLSTKWGILTEYTAFLAVEPGATGFGAADEVTPAMREAFKSAGGGGAPSGGRAAGNIDLLNAPGAPARSAPAEAKAGYVVQQRAALQRDGKIAVNQELNLGRQMEIGCVNPTNSFFDKDMKKVQINSICQVGDQTLFRRDNRWVDAKLVDKELQPERTVEFASDEYNTIVDDLVTKGRQGLIAQGGDCLLLYKGQRVLIKGPGQATE